MAADATEGIARLEGYLLSQRVKADAARAGLVFARRLAWLGPDEQAEVARLFAGEHLALRRQMLRDTVARAHQLRGEYSDRYDLLRRRLVATTLTGAAALAAASALIVWRAAG
ncbi:hypothetical protein J7E93_27430 [Streptomyces sp. ISL-36]|nr:hypothetical protein [Streptomyces sp. ISL-36]